MSVVETESGWRVPPSDVVDIVDAPRLPAMRVSPDHRLALLMSRAPRPGLRDLARPFVRLAGLRIDVARRARRRLGHVDGLELLDIASGQRRALALPHDDFQIRGASWAPDSSHVAVSVMTDEGNTLWLLDVTAGQLRPAFDGYLNDTLYGHDYSWGHDGNGGVELLVLERRHTDPLPPKPAVPDSPRVLQTAGRKATNRTYRDLLTNTHDDAVYAALADSRLVRVALDGTVTRLPVAGLIRAASASPDGRYIRIDRVTRPFSHLVPVPWFGRVIEVVDRAGEAVYALSAQPPAEEVPPRGVRPGPRYAHWRPLQPATLVWVEALDGGDPDREVDHRDRVMTVDLTDAHEPRELTRVPHRLAGLSWLDDGRSLLVTDRDIDRKWRCTRLLDADDRSVEPRVIFDRAEQDRYRSPGQPVLSTTGSGHRVVHTHAGGIYLAGDGATPEGDRPFVDWMSLDTLETRRLFHAELDRYTVLVTLLDEGATSPTERRLLLRVESPTEPPNLVLRDPDGTEHPRTSFPDPHPWLSGVRKSIVTGTRSDGLEISGTLYLPPHADGPLPLLFWAYPREHADPDTAGQVNAQPGRFVRLDGVSPLMFLSQGVAVLVARMPVVGEPRVANDTFVDQIVANARAMVDAVTADGTIDRSRVVVAGHSYGAFMAVNLLAHCDLFAAGIARSGAYNRSLTPFGFQNEPRTLWDAPETYLAVSPLFSADRIQSPLLLVHGAEDNNPGTWSEQSERLFHAIQGLGKTARLVLLPEESHGYQARESILHVLAESFDWFAAHTAGAEAD